MPPRIELIWPSTVDERLLEEIHRVLYAVTELGGAVGYPTPPTRAQTGRWIDDVTAAVRSGDGALALALVDGRVEATGLWRRRAGVFARAADVEKVMAHPDARGLGLGRAVVSALIESARTAGIETLGLGVRGNNHGAIELYEQLGFRVWGRMPNVIAVGAERYDDVRMYLTLGHGPDVVLRGSDPGGPGSSPRRDGPR